MTTRQLLQAQILVRRLERLSADSIWARRASGIRASLDKFVAEINPEGQYVEQKLADLISQYERMKAEGVMPARTINHGPTTSMYYRDPDGNAVEIQVDNFPSIEALNDWFATGKFNENPIGVHFDFEDLVARYRAGEPEASLLHPIEDGEMAPLLDQIKS